MFCRSCGENIPVDSVFCPNCGKNLLAVESSARRTAPQPEPEPEPERAFPRWRARSTKVAVDDNGDEEKLESDTRGINLSVFDRLGLQRLFWVMGLLFAAVGFIVGVTSSTRTAIVWILFGLALLVAATNAPMARHPDPPEQEEATD